MKKERCAKFTLDDMTATLGQEAARRLGFNEGDPVIVGLEVVVDDNGKPSALVTVAPKDE